MRLSRKQSFLISGGVLVAFFSIVFLLQSFKKGGVKISTPVGDASLSIGEDGPKVILENFDRSESKNGKLLWRVKASKGELLTEKNQATLIEPELTLSKDDSKPVSIHSQKAFLEFGGSSLQKAHLMEQVRVIQENPRFTMNSQDALYDAQGQTLLIPSKVEIDSDSIAISGESLVGDLQSSTFTVKGNVKSVIKKREQP